MKISAVLVSGISITLLLLDFLYPLDHQKIQKQLSTRIYDVNGDLLAMKLSRDGYWRFRAEPDEIPSLLKESVLAFEDQYFYWHPGINPVSVIRSIVHNMMNTSTIGASTITMQVARMMQRRDRKLSSKVIEMFNALQIEWYYSKDEILAAYLNLAPYGGNIEGVESAAWFYFKKPLSELSISEIAILTTIPKNPNVNRPDRQKDLADKRDRVLQLLMQKSVLDSVKYERALKEPIRAIRRKAYNIIGHYAYLDEFASGGDFFTAVDLNKQHLCLSVLNSHLANLSKQGVSNGAVLLVNNRSMAVEAYVGSKDFNNAHSLGQNDGIRMIRSPGSTLKPFVYARAFDAGIASPMQQLFDIPMHIKGYNPKNFDKRYYGEISASDALKSSLNIPAIELNKQLGQKSLYELLIQADVIDPSRPKEYYGDAIAIGGVGISLESLAKLYAALANKGDLHDLVFMKDGSPNFRTNLFSPEASFLVTSILSDSNRPEFSAYWESMKNKPKIAFKTGTSAGSRDLYTIAVTPEYTLVVWLGNFDGSQTDGLTGIGSASKVAIEIMNALADTTGDKWFDIPKGIRSVIRCTDALPANNCRYRVYDQLIEGVDIKRPCATLRPETVAYLLENRRIGSLYEINMPECHASWSEMRPMMTLPYEGQEIVMNLNIPEGHRSIPLLCYSFSEDNRINFRIDDTFIPGKSGEIQFVNVEPGVHEIACIDAMSKASKAVFSLIVK